MLLLVHQLLLAQLALVLLLQLRQLLRSTALRLRLHHPLLLLLPELHALQVRLTLQTLYQLLLLVEVPAR